MFCPDGGERAETARGFDVSDETNDDHLPSSQYVHQTLLNALQAYGRRLNDSDRFDNLFLVHLRARSLKIADDGGHPGLVSHGSGEMDWFLWVILWKAISKKFQLRLSWKVMTSRMTSVMCLCIVPLDLASVSGCSLSG